MKHSIHRVHEYNWCIRQPERHYQELIVTIPSPECRFWYIKVFDSQLIIIKPQIKFWKTRLPLAIDQIKHQSLVGDTCFFIVILLSC